MIMDTPFYHLIIYAPEENADAIRKALRDAGAGKIGHYDSCSFSSKGTGRFRPLKGANPAIGSKESLEKVSEERIEVVVQKEDLGKILKAVKEAHPYEEPAMHVLPMLDYHDLL